MTRAEFIQALKELNITQAEFSKEIGRHPITVAKWGVEWDVPHFVVNFIEMMRRDSKARILAFALDAHKRCKNDHDLNEYIGIKNGDLICVYCNDVVEHNIYDRGK